MFSNERKIEFVKLLKKDFTGKVDVQFGNIIDWIEKNQLLYQQIHVDINRGLNFGKKYLHQNQVTVKYAQVIMERYFIDIIMNLTPEIQNKYYQSLTDIFEVIYLVFLDVEVCKKRAEWFPEISLNFKTFYGDCSSFFGNYDYKQIVQISLNVIMYLYKQTKFDVHLMHNKTKCIMNYLKKYDKQFYKKLSQVSDDEFKILTLKHMVSCCLHDTDSFDISIQLSTLLLTKDIDQQAFVVQQLLSISIRSTCPDLISEQVETYTDLQLEKIAVQPLNNVDQYVFISQLHEILSKSISLVLIDGNAEQIIHFLQNVVQKYNKYKLEENLAIAGIAAGAVLGGTALIAGVVIGILGAVFKQKGGRR